MHFCEVTLAILIFLWTYFLSADANAMLKPSHRGMMWTRGAYNSAGYNYMGINCGGISRYRHNNGKCGLCGDPSNGPRDHETGGKYATGAIADILARGRRTIRTSILLNTDQGGYFEFRLCASNGTAESQECFDKHLLKIREGRLQGDELAFIVQRGGIIPLTIEIPEKVYCEQCVLQWKYITGNTFGRDEHGRGCLGCGSQETFINCADISIKGWVAPPTVPTTTPLPTTPTLTTTTTMPPPTTIIPTPPTTVHVPLTTATRQTKITKARQIQNTQPARVVTQQRNHVTDVDEGSRRRFGNGKRAYNSVPAPTKVTVVSPPIAPQRAPTAPTRSPIVPQRTPTAPARSPIVPQRTPTASARSPIVPLRSTITPKQSPTQTSFPVRLAAVNQPATIVVRQRTAVDKVKTINHVLKKNSKQSTARKIPSPIARKMSFNIPRPPRLSTEQIDALNNNNNVIPHYDPFQKYIRIGSSKIIAARDFATMRARQVQTPPTVSKGHESKSRHKQTTSSTKKTTYSGRVQTNTSKRQLVRSKDYSTFGNEMLGGVLNAPKQSHQHKNNVGHDLMNEYGTVSDAGISVNQQRHGDTKYQQRYGNSQHVNVFNDFVVGPANVIFSNNPLATVSKQRSRYGSAKMHVPREKKPQGNRHFSMDKAISKIKRVQPSSSKTNSRLLEANMFGAANSDMLIRAPTKSLTTGSQDSSTAMKLKQSNKNNYMSANKVLADSSRHKSANNALGLPTRYRYGQMSNPVLPKSPVGTNKQRQVADVKRLPNRKTTKLPVIDTSTHQVQQISADTIAPWRKRVNGQTHTNFNMLNTSINLFNKQKRTQFTAPVVYERFTNYQVGGSRNKQKAIPRGLLKAINKRQQSIEKVDNSTTLFRNLHLNAEIHSPQNYFGQDHYIAQDVGLSVPAFGGTKTQDTQSQQALNLGKQRTEHIKHTLWSDSQQFPKMHLNKAIHTADNYFAYGIDKGVNTMKTSGNPYSVNSAFGKALTHTGEGAITKVTLTATHRKPSTQTPITTTTVVQSTTSNTEYQMQQLSKLHEKINFLQQLIKRRQFGTTTPRNPTVHFQNPKQPRMNVATTPDNTVAVGNRKVAQTTNNQNANSQISSNSDSTNRFQDNNYNNNIGNHNINAKTTKPAAVITANVNTGMNKETTQYIHNFKTQMMKSIKHANARKMKQVAGSNGNILRNKNSTSHPWKPYTLAGHTYVTPQPSVGRSPNQVSTDSTITNTVQQNQQKKDNLAKQKQQREKRFKYRKLIELLIQRRKSRQLAEKQERDRLQQHAHQTRKQTTQPRQRQPSVQQRDPRQLQQLHQTQEGQQSQSTQHHVDNQRLNHVQHTQNRQPQQYNIHNQGISSKSQPRLAEIQVKKTKKERIYKTETQARNGRGTIQPTTNNLARLNGLQKYDSAVAPTGHKSTAVKTTIDTLAQKLAIRMAQTINTGNGMSNVKVLPLSRDSVMEVLRNIALSVLKDQNRKRQLPLNTPDNHNSLHSLSRGHSHKQSEIMLKPPPTRELHVTNDVHKQTVISMNAFKTPTVTDKQQVDALTQNTYAIQTNEPAISPENVAKQQAFIRYMKAQMRRRRPANIQNSRDNSNQQKYTHSSNARRTVNDNRTATTNYNAISSLHRQAGDVPQHGRTTMTDNHGAIQANVDNNGNRKNISTQRRVRLSPDVAKSMLLRVKEMLAKRNGGDNKPMSTNDVLVMPLNKDTLYKLIKSMAKKRNGKSGR